jgi:hypothetical protein
MIIPATQEHVAMIAAEITPEGVTELAEVYGMTPAAAAQHNFDISPRKWTMFAEGEILAMFGVYPLEADGVGEFWIIGTQSICRHKVAFARSCRRFMPTVKDGWRELLCVLEHGRADVLKWALWCGARVKRIDDRLSFTEV